MVRNRCVQAWSWLFMEKRYQKGQWRKPRDPARVPLKGLLAVLAGLGKD